MASMASRKRAFNHLVPEERLMSLRLADAAGGGGAALSADRLPLQVASECAAGLPGDAVEWDLSGLLIEGQPVGRGVVVAWLHAVTTHSYDEPFAGEAQQEPPLNRSAAGLTQLLAFADAVGSSRGVLRACLPPWDQLQFGLQVGEEEVQLEVGGAYLWERDHALQLWRAACLTGDSLVHTAASPGAKAQLSQQFARQVEALLYLAHRLQLDSLARALHTCVRYNTAWGTSLLADDDSSVDPAALSARVLEAAAGPGQQSKLAFINSIVTEPASFVAGTQRRQVFQPVGLGAEQREPLAFTAELAVDFLGAGSPGKVVDVELDLFGEGLITVAGATHTAQLLLGPRVSRDALGQLVRAHGVE